MKISMFGHLIPGIREIAKNNGATISLKGRWPEIRKGYMIGDRVLRHARVAVSRPPADDEPAAENE